MRIRTYQPGDEAVQAEIYNEAAAALPKFKAATVEEVRRRCQAADFDPATRFFAELNGRPVGYATLQGNGRLSYPWCRKGFESAADALFERVLEAVRERGLSLAFVAYRGDWQAQQGFFRERGFHLAREMVNFVLDISDLPTRPSRPRLPHSSLRPGDIPAIRALAPGVLRVRSAAELEEHLCRNHYFTSDAVFVLRTGEGETPIGAGIFIQNAGYADPNVVDPAMPCFRLGAFGTEGMTTKRIDGLFSFLVKDDAQAAAVATALLDEAANRLEQTGATTWNPRFAAQVPSDASQLLHFYEQHFRRQGSFPILEREFAPDFAPAAR